LQIKSKNAARIKTSALEKPRSKPWAVCNNRESMWQHAFFYVWSTPEWKHQRRVPFKGHLRQNRSKAHGSSDV